MRFQVYRSALDSPSLNAQLETLVAEFQLAFEGNAENQRAQAIRVGPPTARRVLGEGIRGWNRSRTVFQAWRACGMVQWRAQASRSGRRSLFSVLPRRQFSGVEGRAPAKSYSGLYARPARASLVGKTRPDSTTRCRKQTTYGRWNQNLIQRTVSYRVLTWSRSAS